MVSLEKRLLRACSQGDLDQVKECLEAGANMNAISSTGRTALGTAALSGNTAILKELLDNTSKNKGTSSNRSNLGYFVFVHEDHESLGYEKDRFEDLPTDWLDCYGDEEVLTPDGMDNLEWDMEVEDELNIQHEENDPACALYMWYAGILSQTSPLLGKTPPPNDLDREDQHGRCALHYGVMKGHLDAVLMLINAGCKVNVRDSGSETPLHIAASSDTPEILEALICAGAKVNQKSVEKMSPLHISSSEGLLDNVKLLVKAGASVNAIDDTDRTPLFLAVSRNRERVVEYLLNESNAKVNVEDAKGHTPLCESVWQRNVTIAQKLLKRNARITQSHYLLHFAILNRHLDMVALLVDAGCIINLKDMDGITPLILAVQTNQPQVAELLLKHGANVNAVNSVSGFTVLQEAVQNIRHVEAFEEMLTVLQDYRVDLEQWSSYSLRAVGMALIIKKVAFVVALVRRGASLEPAPQELADDRTVNPLQLLLGSSFLVHLFVLAGNRLHLLPWVSHKPEVRQLVHNYKTNPLRLCDLCRVLIRRLLKGDIYSKVPQLGLPTVLERFLKLEDLVYTTTPDADSRGYFDT